MKKMKNFVRALENLHTLQGKEPPYDTITLAGMVSLFEICFEQAWKAMKEALEESGYSKRQFGSPRAVIKMAYQGGMIADEMLWLAALQARNDVIHSYSEPIALAIIRDSQEKFLPMFTALAAELKKNWQFAERP